jgi:hypothetical protein
LRSGNKFAGEREPNGLLLKPREPGLAELSLGLFLEIGPRLIFGPDASKSPFVGLDREVTLFGGGDVWEVKGILLSSPCSSAADNC